MGIFVAGEWTWYDLLLQKKFFHSLGSRSCQSMAVFLSKEGHMTHGLAGDTSLHARLDTISSVANPSVLGSITGLPPCPVTAIAGVCPLFPSCPCSCSHRNCCLVLCLSASRYFMFGDDPEVEWNFLKKPKQQKQRREARVWGGDYLSLVQNSLVFQVCFWSADTN